MELVFIYLSSSKSSCLLMEGVFLWTCLTLWGRGFNPQIKKAAIYCNATHIPQRQKMSGTWLIFVHMSNVNMGACGLFVTNWVKIILINISGGLLLKSCGFKIEQIFLDQNLIVWKEASQNHILFSQSQWKVSYSIEYSLIIPLNF